MDYLSLPSTSTNTTNVKRLSALSGETLILSADGELYSLDELANDYDATAYVTCFDGFGRITTGKAHDFRIVDWVDEVYNITFASGLKARTNKTHEFLAATDQWVPTEELEFGSIVKGSIYDNRKGKLMLNLDEVAHIHVEKLDEKVPMYDFTVDKYENLFIAEKTGDSISLVAAHNSLVG